ncbi:CBS domain-containing protein [Bacillaceae bacterium W0354]
MFVKSIMLPANRCFTASKNETLKEVIEAFDRHDIEGMPVIEDGKYIGMISKQRIYEYYFEIVEENKEKFLSTRYVHELVNNENFYVEMEDVFEKTLKTLKGYPIIAVVDEEKNFLGLVSRYDVIEQFESAFGLKKSGVRIAFSAQEQEGSLAKVSEVLKKYNENVIALATFDETGKLARRIVLKVEKNEQTNQFINQLEKSGFRILDVKEM